jgi:hypothetical protein
VPQVVERFEVQSEGAGVEELGRGRHPGFGRRGPPRQTAQAARLYAPAVTRTALARSYRLSPEESLGSNPEDFPPSGLGSGTMCDSDRRTTGKKRTGRVVPDLFATPRSRGIG